MYIIFSLAGNTGRWFTTSRVLDSLRPNRLGRPLATAARFFTMAMASANLGSCPKASSGTSMSKPSVSLRMPRRRSGPRRVGLSLTHVSTPRSWMR